MNAKWPSRFALFVALSLLLHVLAILAGLVVIKPQPRTQLESVVVTLLPKKLGIADIPKPDKEQRPDDAKLAALYDQKVAREQVARPSSGKSRAKKTTPPTEAKKGPPQPPTERFTSAGALSPEFYPDYEYGNQTYVNALRYPNIAYFVELKRRFQTAFNPRNVIRQHLNQITQGKIEVVLGVTVDPRGGLTDLVVIKASAVDAYDAVALRTVKTSAPFSAPPANLLDRNGLLRMSWTFTVYL